MLIVPYKSRELLTPFALIVPYKSRELLTPFALIVPYKSRELLTPFVLIVPYKSRELLTPFALIVPYKSRELLTRFVLIVPYSYEFCKDSGRAQARPYKHDFVNYILRCTGGLEALASYIRPSHRNCRIGTVYLPKLPKIMRILHI